MLPVIVPGCTGTLLTVSASEVVAEVPQPFCAATVMLPLFAPMVTVIVVSVELPVVPLGNVQM